MVGLQLTTPLLRKQVSELIVCVYFDSFMHLNIDMVPIFYDMIINLMSFFVVGVCLLL